MRREEGCVGREKSDAKHDLLHEQTQMSQEDGPGLLQRNAMPLLLLSASLDPCFNFGRVARIHVEATAEIVEKGAEHPNVTVHRGGSKQTGTAAVMQAGFTKLWAGKTCTCVRPFLLRKCRKRWTSIGEARDMDGAVALGGAQEEQTARNFSKSARKLSLCLLYGVSQTKERRVTRRLSKSSRWKRGKGRG